MKRRFLIPFLFCACATAGFAADSLRFAGIISDSMILQQEKPIKVWGWAQAGAEVAVTLTQDRAVGEGAIAKAVEQGSRRAKPADSADEYSVRVTYVEKNPPVYETQTIKAKAGTDGRWLATFAPAKASFQETWIAAQSGDRSIAVENLLIGEIWVCAGQSNMGWSNFNRKDREAASADFPGLRYVAWHESWYKPLDDLRKPVRWEECSPQTAEKFSAVPYLYGMFLHRYLKVPVGVINVARGGTLGQTWCLREELEGIDHVTVKTSLKKYDAETATWDEPAEVERLMAEWKAACEKVKNEHVEKVAKAKADGKKEPRLRLPKQPGDPRSGWSPPAGLFNATVMPIRDLGVRGVLYYQGENNNFMRWTRYEHTFPKVPVSFRKAFGDANLPFGCISQPGWGTFGLEPEIATIAEGYAIVRDIQRRALETDANAGMIVTYPTGNSYIHPAEKLPVAEYASLWALAEVYKKPVVHRANEFTEMKVGDGKLHLYFDSHPIVYERWKHIENNASWQVLPQPREGNAERLGFIVAGENRRWYPATAKEVRVDGKWCIEVSNDLVDKPVAARYGWANWPTGNMVGRGRLPMQTFRTDDWPIPEGVIYSEEAKSAASEKLKQLKAQAEVQVLDRKLRQMQLDLPKLEESLHKGSVAGQLGSKVARMEAIFDELQKSDWLSRGIAREQPELAAKINALREQFDALKAESAPLRPTK